MTNENQFNDNQSDRKLGGRGEMVEIREREREGGEREREKERERGREGGRERVCVYVSLCV